jgi:hypothetical protein
MADWIICPSCNLRHSRRGDARCPRCLESVERASSEPVATAPPIEPGRAVPAPAPASVGAVAENRPSFNASRPAARQPSAMRPVGPRPVASRRDRAPAPALGNGALESSWLVRGCRTREVRALSTACALTVVTFLLLAGQVRYFTNFFVGPYPTSAEELQAIHDASAAPHYFVRVEGGRAIDLGLEEYEVSTENGRETGRTLKARFFALETGDRLLVVKTSGAAASFAEGELRPFYTDLETHLFSSPEMRKARPRFHPYFLDTDSFRSSGYWGLGLGALFLAAMAAWGSRAWRRLKDPSSHPVLAQVAAWGDLAALSAEIESEAARPWRSVRSFKIGDRYVVKVSFYGLSVLRLSDLLWAYKKVVRKRVNFIPVGKDYHAVLCCVGGSAEVLAKDAVVDEILQHAAARAPWAIFGHTQEIANAFRKDTAGFVAAVAERRRQFEAEHTAAAS